MLTSHHPSRIRGCSRFAMVLHKHSLACHVVRDPFQFHTCALCRERVCFLSRRQSFTCPVSRSSQRIHQGIYLPVLHVILGRPMILMDIIHFQNTVTFIADLACIHETVIQCEGMVNDLGHDATVFERLTEVVNWIFFIKEFQADCPGPGVAEHLLVLRRQQTAQGRAYQITQRHHITGSSLK